MIATRHLHERSTTPPVSRASWVTAAAAVVATACGPAPDATADGGWQSSVTASQRAAIDAIVAPLIDSNGAEGKAVGIAVGVFGPGVRDVLGYGSTVKGGSTVPDQDT